MAASQRYIVNMSVTEILQEIDRLSKEERWKVVEHVNQLVEEDIPESFKRGMADAQAGRFVDMETALHQTPPSRQ